MIVFCTRCGAQNSGASPVCYACQARLPAVDVYQPTYEPIQPPPTYRPALVNWQARGADKKVPAGICGILFGVLGVHKFILGYTAEGIIQLIIGLITCGAGSVIGLIEGIIYLTKSDEDFVRTYVENKRGWF
jgi:TM2 domain-containing membrane protein YozV